MLIDSRFSVVVHKKGRNLSIKREPLDGAYSNRHPAYMRDTTNGVETYQTGLSICCKKLSRFSLLDELPFCPGYFSSR